MKKNLAIFILLLIICEVTAQDKTDDRKYTLGTINNKIGISSLHLFDYYLSPLDYDGLAVTYNYDKRKLFSSQHLNLSNQQRFELSLGSTENKAGTSTMVYLGLNAGWGMHYHFRPVKNLQILTGGFWDAGLGLKYNLRNVNNPFNMDIYTNLNASLVLLYDIPTRRGFNFRLQALVETPFIGAMFAPELGESYYEMFTLKTESQLVHFSSFHNKQAIRDAFAVYFTWNRCILSLTYTHNYMKYKANNIVFKTIHENIALGWSYNVRTFAGRKNKAPENFILY